MIRPMLRVAVLLLSAFALAPASAQETIEIIGSAQVRIETSLGDIIVRLDANRAPLTVQHFLQYVIEGHYEGTVFHRVDPTFLVQGGGFLPDLTRKPAERMVPNESGNGLSNRRGTIGMARANDPHGASSEFYFNLVDNAVLDPRPSRWGYAVFGQIVEGIEVIDRIASVPTGSGGQFDREVPAEPIFIERIQLIQE